MWRHKMPFLAPKQIYPSFQTHPQWNPLRSQYDHYIDSVGLSPFEGKFTNSACPSCLKQPIALVKMVQLSPLTDKRMRRNVEKGEETKAP